MIDLVLTGGTVVPMDPERRIIEDGAVAIDKGRVVAVGTSAEIEQAYPAIRTMNCRGRAIIPGLIDAHGHGGHSLIKTLGADRSALWMRMATPTYFHFTTPEFWYVDGLVSALERLRFGVTTGVSVMASQPRSDEPILGINHARAYREVGVREIVATGPCHTPWPHPVSRWVDGKRERRDVTFDEAMAGAEAVIETCNHDADDMIRVFITPFGIVPSIDPSNPTTPDLATTLTAHDRMQARRIREVARKWKTRIHSDAFGGMVRMAMQDPENALLGPDVHLQHCRGISIEEVRILVETGTHVTHAPSAGQAMGRCPVPEIMEAGGNVAITTDGTSPKTSFDLFQAARKTQMVHQMLLRDMYLFPVGKLLEMITIDAARAIGWDDEIGSLEPGKRADVTIVNMRQPHLTPNWMVVHRLIYEAVGNDVETVIVNGRVVMENCKVLTVNEDDVLDEGQREGLAVVERAGLQAHMSPPGWGKTRLTFDEPIAFPE